jgi:hypothetical protein
MIKYEIWKTPKKAKNSCASLLFSLFLLLMKAILVTGIKNISFHFTPLPSPNPLLN